MMTDKQKLEEINALAIEAAKPSSERKQGSTPKRQLIKKIVKLSGGSKATQQGEQEESGSDLL